MIEEVQRYGDWWEQRKEYRQQALVDLRKREGIPAPELIDGKWMYRDSEGEPYPWAVGKQTLPSAEEMDQFWDGVDARTFEIREVASDGRPISDEIRDLERDAQLIRDTQSVSFGDSSEPNPDFRLDSLDDASVDSAIQKMVNHHE